MGDRNPKSQAKNKKQGDLQKEKDQAAHDKKQAHDAPVVLPGGKRK
jgi:hypothetical protein